MKVLLPGLVALLLAAPPPPGARAATQTADATAQKSGEQLQLPLGSIVLDRENRRFSVPGQILRVDPPLEYVAVAKGGWKAYESFLELDTTGMAFNVACVLIGFEPPKESRPDHQFDRKPIGGMRVKLWLEWSGGNGTERVPIEELLWMQGSDKTPGEWVYLGSGFAPGGPYLADQTGTLIGFVHDPIAVIEHRTGLGIGSYGAVGAERKRTPPVGTKVTLSVERVQ